ncbi:protein-disulfide reductase DsbD [uncultured Parasutterella sp.]|jgi:Thiol:disulfide interchange protein|uniref:protein-disulfide reductase DsbD family protein n=1 Tax=uncultured Parasutterella sp. TaxID=1263098 RepID=UPI0027295752|nr:thioredoxin family protein [uncultured Parasutterella sp.]
MSFLRLLRLLFLSLFFIGLSVQAQPWKKPEPVQAELVSRFHDAVPGTEFEIGLLLRHDSKWHTYWKSTGDTGLPTRIQWSLPQGWHASEILWPTPDVFKIGDLVNYGYGDEVLLPVRISVPASAEVGSVQDIKAEVSWLMCADQCVPGKASLTLAVQVADKDGGATKTSTLFEASHTAMPSPLSDASGVFDPKTHAVRVTFKSTEPFHHFYVFAEGDDSVVYGAPQSVSRSADKISVTLQGTDELKAGSQFSGVFAADGGPRKGGWAGSFSVPLESGTVAAPTVSDDTLQTGLSSWLAVAMAFIGGLILNVMPCVFPVLSLKILSLVQDRQRINLPLHGVVFTLGVLLTMLVLAGVLIAVKSAGISVGWGFQLQSPIFVASLAVIFAAISVNLLGWFEFSCVRVSGGSYSNSLLNCFATGVLAVVAASPCTAPFMGAALGYALTASIRESIFVFLALGLGMSLPWLVLSLFPVLTAWMPKPGAWMNVFRKLMAIPMLLTMIWLLWVLSQQVSFTALVLYIAAVISLCVCLFLYGKLQFSLLTAKLPIVLSAACAVLLFAAASSSLFRQPDAAVQAADAWSPQAVENALEAGKPVFVDFTASWCVTCQANKIAVLDREDIREAFKQHGVVFLVADWTNQNPDITQALESFGRSGVPLYILYSPDGKTTVLPELLTKNIVIGALDKLPSN